MPTAVSEMHGANMRAILVTTTGLSTSSGNSTVSTPASVCCIQRRFFARASISALTAPMTTSTSGSSRSNSSTDCVTFISTCLPCDWICCTSADENMVAGAA